MTRRFWVKAGSTLIGGTLNRSGGLIMRASKIGSDTMLSCIVAMVAQAQRSRAPIQRLADQVSGWFVPLVIGVQALPATIPPGTKLVIADQKDYGEGTGRQPFVFNALKLAGLTRKDVKLVPRRAADFPDAVRSGQVAAGFEARIDLGADHLVIPRPRAWRARQPGVEPAARDIQRFAKPCPVLPTQICQIERCLVMKAT